jgi:predicted transcriptional regulator
MKNTFEFFTSFCLIVLIAVAINDHWPVQAKPVVKAEQSEAAQLQKKISEDKIEALEKEGKKKDRRIKRLVYKSDSLTMEHIRKDGLLGDSSSFIITRPVSKKKTRYQQLKEEHEKQWQELPAEKSDQCSN